MAELTSLRNIGKTMEKMLNAVDIFTAEQLKQVGSKEAFFRLKSRDPSVCTVYLYTLEGTISDTECNQLSEDARQDLRDFSNSL